MIQSDSVSGAERAAQIEALVMGGTSAEAVATKFGITPNRVYQILGKTTKREQLLLFLLEHKDEKWTSKEIARAISVDIKKIEFQVDRLHKRGRLKATHKPTVDEAGNHKMWVDIQLTTAGIAEAKTLVPKQSKAPDKPVARVLGEPTPMPELVRERIPERLISKLDDHIAGLDDHVEKKLDLRAHTLAVSDIPRFPLINAIVERGEKVAKLTAAAKLLEEAGEDDLALGVLGKTQFAPLEREVLHFVELYGKDLK